MSRVKRGVTASARHKKCLKRSSGYYSSRSRTFKCARVAVDKALLHAYVGRKLRKRDFRRLWIQRIGAFARERGFSYSKFMFILKRRGINLNRKILAHLAYVSPDILFSLIKEEEEIL